MVAQLTLAGPIGPAAAEYVDDAMRRAGADGAAAIVLRLDTPGGLAEAMRQIIARMLASKVPVLVFVAPAGARAASAGTYILYAGQVAAMAPATHVGAATPVQLGGHTTLPPPGPGAAGSTQRPAAAEQDAEAAKVTNDAIAYLRALAQLRGRNAAWPEQAVRGAATLTAAEAARRQVIDFVAADVADLLARSDGREVRVGDRRVTLHLRGATVRDYPPGARTRFLGVITEPTVAYLLLLAGIYGLVLEALHPGTLLPGIAGGICLLVGLYALQLLPVNYAGLALMALGLGLLAAEAINPTIGALGAGGLVAFVIGSVMLMNEAVPGYGVNLGVIAGIALAAGLSLAALAWLVLRSRRPSRRLGDPAMTAELAVLLEPLDVAGEGWALARGERWRVRCDAPLPAGAMVRVVRREGLLLWVEPA
ncbi:MAG TPA: NfeD family protein [Frateuria sp.]|uniref:NfeD family protein n=1 Tax=Frateuria sp. TaxID=2211372 RepID=UPI002D7E4185|nr:NfeD family protein [Frateuria sp.]HET6804761.1 NfeD family protein [Frateuria sp.]